MLPRKKEIIIYANMTEHQKQIQDHLVEKTFDNYLHEESDIGMLAYISLNLQSTTPLCSQVTKIELTHFCHTSIEETWYKVKVA